MHHRPCAYPFDERAAIGRAEHIGEGVVLARLGEAFVLRDEMQVVVAEHDDRALAERSHEAQRLQRLRASVDEVADEPKTVALRELDTAEEGLQLVEEALPTPAPQGR